MTRKQSILFIRLRFALSIITFDEHIIYKELLEAKYEKLKFDILIQEKNFITVFDETEIASIAQNLYELMKIDLSLVSEVLDDELISSLKVELDLN